MRPKINEFKFGEVYGENEVLYLQNYPHYFYDINGSLSKLNRQSKIIVIGRKGTGKTLLVNVYCQKQKELGVIAVVETLKDFVFHELIHFQGKDISSTKYVPIFKWMILVNIAKNIVKESDGFSEEKVEVLKSFLRSFGHIAGELRPEKTIEITKEYQTSGEAKVGFKVPGFSAGIKGNKGEVEKAKEVKKDYIECLESLNLFLKEMIKESSKKVCIFYDELDDKFDSSEEYKNAMVSFMNAITSINKEYYIDGIDIKIGAVIRHDIINTLSSPNINRIIEDNSIVLDWATTQPKASDSEIFDMLSFKIKKSADYYDRITSDELFTKIFCDKVAGEHCSIYMLHRTLGRPRDAIRMLTYIQEEFGDNAERFESYMFTSVLGKYSSYLLREIRSELAGHLNDEEIDDCFSLLRSVKKRGFTHPFITEKYNSLKFNDESPTLNAMLSSLFKVGAIGNVVKRSRVEGGDAYLWSYGNEDLQVDLSMNFEIHCGLWDALNVIKPRSRF